MKITIKFLFYGACVSLLFACTKSELVTENLSGVDLKSASINHHGEVFMVNPNGVNDTQAILDAFNLAKAAGSGSVVELTKGTFKIGFIEIQNFEGSFRGAGKGKTIITNLPDLPCVDVEAKSKYPALLKFIAGNFSMSDMTIHMNDGIASATPEQEGTGGDLYSILFLTDESFDYTPPIRHIKASVDNVDFIAGYDGGTVGYSPFGGTTMYNVWTSVMVAVDNFNGGPASIGDISITRCKMENDVFGIWIWGFDAASSANVENNQFTGGIVQVFLTGCLGSEVKVKNNQFQKGLIYDVQIDNWGWWWASDVTLINRAHYTITGNNFQSPKGVTSLVMNDGRRLILPNEGYPQMFDVTGNNFETRDEGMAIQSLNNVDAKIWNNKFMGTGTVGVSIDGDAATSTYAENINVIGNNFCKAIYTDASVYLGPNSKDCKVVGVKTDQVVDLGINNSIIGTKAHKSNVQTDHHSNIKYSSVFEKMIRRGRK